jgi:hypothetical protein
LGLDPFLLLFFISFCVSWTFMSMHVTLPFSFIGFLVWRYIYETFRLNRSTLSETPHKASPATPTPRVSRPASRGVAKSESDSPSPLQNSRLSVDRSPRSVTSKPTIERRSPKLATPPEVSITNALQMLFVFIYLGHVLFGFKSWDFDFAKASKMRTENYRRCHP